MEDYKEKYEKALEKASIAYKDEDRHQKATLERIFPELSESEDEKIRNRLLDFFNSFRMANGVKVKWEGLDVQKVIAWLEKQAGQKSLDDVAKEITKNKENAISFLKSCGIMNANGELADEYKIEQDKQEFEEVDNLHIYLYGEQKPADKVEPRFKVGDKIRYLKCGGTIMTIEKIENGEYIFGNNMGHTSIEDGNNWYLVDIVEQKPAWNKESSAFKDKLLELFQKFRYIKEGVPTNGDIMDYVDAHIQELIGTIRNNPWSEEDERMLDFAIRAVGLCKQYAINHQVNGYSKLPDVPKRYEELQNWLKSIKPQSQWKPSDEQMRVLDLAIRCGINRGTTEETTLVSLFNDLKKLKE